MAPRLLTLALDEVTYEYLVPFRCDVTRICYRLNITSRYTIAYLYSLAARYSVRRPSLLTLGAGHGTESVYPSMSQGVSHCVFVAAFRCNGSLAEGEWG
jgi:hypothetical protein